MATPSSLYVYLLKSIVKYFCISGVIKWVDGGTGISLKMEPFRDRDHGNTTMIGHGQKPKSSKYSFLRFCHLHRADAIPVLFMSLAMVCYLEFPKSHRKPENFWTFFLIFLSFFKFFLRFAFLLSWFGWSQLAFPWGWAFSQFLNFWIDCKDSLGMDQKWAQAHFWIKLLSSFEAAKK